MDQVKDFFQGLIDFIMFFINAIKELVAGVRGPSIIDQIKPKPEATTAVETTNA